jgi:SnoaL-like domain
MSTEMTDREAITDQIYRYCRAMDRMDHALGYSIWHDDGLADYGADVFQGTGRDFVDHVCLQHRHLLHHSHQMSNIIIALDGDKAGSESYVTATLRMKRGDAVVQMTVWSRYVDTWSRRDGRWALDQRIAIRDFDEIREVKAMQDHDIGQRDRTDPSYTVLK